MSERREGRLEAMPKVLCSRHAAQGSAVTGNTRTAGWSAEMAPPGTGAHLIPRPLSLLHPSSVEAEP